MPHAYPLGRYDLVHLTVAIVIVALLGFGLGWLTRDAHPERERVAAVNAALEGGRDVEVGLCADGTPISIRLARP